MKPYMYVIWIWATNLSKRLLNGQLLLSFGHTHVTSVWNYIILAATAVATNARRLIYAHYYNNNCGGWAYIKRSSQKGG